MRELVVILIVYLITINGRAHHGRCPNIKSDDIYTNKSMIYNTLFHSPFEMFTPRQYFFPTKSFHNLVIVRNLNLFSIVATGLSCTANMALRQNKETLGLDYILTFHNVKKQCEIEDKVEMKFAIKISGFLAVIWGCAQIDKTSFEEAIWVLAYIINEHHLDSQTNTINWMKPLVLRMLENRTKTTDLDFEYVLKRYGSDFNQNYTDPRICDNYQCQSIFHKQDSLIAIIFFIIIIMNCLWICFKY